MAFLGVACRECPTSVDVEPRDRILVVLAPREDVLSQGVREDVLPESARVLVVHGQREGSPRKVSDLGVFAPRMARSLLVRVRQMVRSRAVPIPRAEIVTVVVRPVQGETDDQRVLRGPGVPLRVPAGCVPLGALKMDRVGPGRDATTRDPSAPNQADDRALVAIAHRPTLGDARVARVPRASTRREGGGVRIRLAQAVPVAPLTHLPR